GPRLHVHDYPSQDPRIDGGDRGACRGLLNRPVSRSPGMNAEFDVIVIGSGAGGAAAAYRLASAGQKVLLIEKGNALPTDGSTQDLATVFGRGAFNSKEVWRDRHGHNFAPQEHFNLGGKTMLYGAALLRLAPEEFLVDEEFQYHAWPIGYDDL